MTDPYYKRGTIRKDGKLYGRTVGGGKLVNALTAASGGICVFVEL